MHQIISTDHLEQIFHAVHDNVIFGPAQALHIDSHNLGPDAAQEEIITIVLWWALVGPHSLGLPGVDLTHGHLSEMCQGASFTSHTSTLYMPVRFSHNDLSSRKTGCVTTRYKNDLFDS